MILISLIYSMLWNVTDYQFFEKLFYCLENSVLWDHFSEVEGYFQLDGWTRKIGWIDCGSGEKYFRKIKKVNYSRKRPVRVAQKYIWKWVKNREKIGKTFFSDFFPQKKKENLHDLSAHCSCVSHCCYHWLCRRIWRSWRGDWWKSGCDLDRSW